MHRQMLLAVVCGVLILAGAVVACRQDEPAGDPRTPANAPLPDLEKKDEPKPAPKLPFTGDAG